jgi:hypothetical protein
MAKKKRYRIEITIRVMDLDPDSEGRADIEAIKFDDDLLEVVVLGVTEAFDKLAGESREVIVDEQLRWELLKEEDRKGHVRNVYPMLRLMAKILLRLKGAEAIMVSSDEAGVYRELLEAAKRLEEAEKGIDY